MQALRKAACKKIFREKLSGASRERPEFQRCSISSVTVSGAEGRQPVLRWVCAGPGANASPRCWHASRPSHFQLWRSSPPTKKILCPGPGTASASLPTTLTYSGKMRFLGLVHMLPRVVGASYQRSRFDMPETHRKRIGLEFGELGRRHVAHDGKMIPGRLQVLPERQDVAFDTA